MTNPKINLIDHSQSIKLAGHCSSVLSAMEEIEMPQSEIQKLEMLFTEAIDTMRQLEWNDFIRRADKNQLLEEFRSPIENSDQKRAAIRHRLQTLEEEVAYLRSLND